MADMVSVGQMCCNELFAAVTIQSLTRPNGGANPIQAGALVKKEDSGRGGHRACSQATFLSYANASR